MMQKLAGTGNPFGTVDPGPAIIRFSGGQVAGVPILVSILVKSLIMMSAIYAIFNFILAGYWYISGSADPKRLHDSTAKIWQTVLGLTVAAGSIVIAGVVGQILFKNPNAILQITIFTP